MSCEYMVEAGFGMGGEMGLRGGGGEYCACILSEQ